MKKIVQSKLLSFRLLGIVFLILIINYDALSQENKISDSPIFSTVMNGRNLFCVGKESLKFELAAFAQIPQISNIQTPGAMGTLACYQCCVGEEGYTEANCKRAGYNNWQKGSKCGCT